MNCPDCNKDLSTPTERLYNWCEHRYGKFYVSYWWSRDTGECDIIIEWFSTTAEEITLTIWEKLDEDRIYKLLLLQ